MLPTWSRPDAAAAVIVSRVRSSSVLTETMPRRTSPKRSVLTTTGGTACALPDTFKYLPLRVGRHVNASGSYVLEIECSSLGSAVGFEPVGLTRVSARSGCGRQGQREVAAGICPPGDEGETCA